MKRAISAWRVSSSGARRIAEGWTVAITFGARGEGTNLPRSVLTRNCLPSNAWAAVAPRHTTACGWILAISASSHGLLRSIRAAAVSERRRPPSSKPHVIPPPAAQPPNALYRMYRDLKTGAWYVEGCYD